MSETKHTRAPWFAVDGLDQEGEKAILIDCEDGLNDDFVICIMQGEDAEANARLIAVAPELLAKATKAMDYLNSMAHLEPAGVRILEELAETVLRANGGTFPPIID